MKVYEGFKLSEGQTNSQDLYIIKLCKSLYGLKQTGRMWYNHLSGYLLKEGYKNDLICPWIFTKRFDSGFIIITIYVDDLNLIGSPKEFEKVVDCLKWEFEMKDLGESKFCLGLQIEDTNNGTLLH